MADRCPKCGRKGFESGDSACESCGWEDPVLEPWVPSGMYADPANPALVRYWSQPFRSWVGKSRKDLTPTPIPTTPPLAVLEAQDPTLKPIARPLTCVVLGGHGLGVPVNASVELVFTLDAVRLRQRGTDDTVVPYADIEAFEIGGPGAKQTGGGFFGGGFGLEAAAEGALIATALNMLTKRTTVDTVICLRTRTAELFLHTSAETPDALRMRLSQVFNILRAQSTAQQAGSAASTGSGSDDVVDRLAKLADMLDKGLITSDEFATLKSTLLAEHGAS